MTKFNNHIQKSSLNDKETPQKEAIIKIKRASKHLWMNVIAYLFIFISEYFLATMGHSAVLKADAFNNLSGVISTFLLMIGLKAATHTTSGGTRWLSVKLAKKRLPLSWLSRFRFQTIFTLITSIIMIIISFQIILSGVNHLHVTDSTITPQPLTAVGAAIASITMLVVWFFNRKIGRELNNVALLASAQDSLSDALTSIGTLLSISGAIFFQIKWLDPLASVVVGLFILYSGFLIFRESSLNLVDYVDPKLESTFRQTILSIADVNKVVNLRAHYSGDLVSIDVVIAVDPQMTTLKSYELGEIIKGTMRKKYGVADMTVAVMPDSKSI